MNELLGRNFQSYKGNDRNVLLSNFKTVGQIQAELHSLLKVEKLDVCVRLFCKFGHIFLVHYDLVHLSCMNVRMRDLSYGSSG